MQPGEGGVPWELEGSLAGVVSGKETSGRQPAPLGVGPLSRWTGEPLEATAERW